MSHSQRGLNWFNALSAGASEVSGLPASLKVADGLLGAQAGALCGSGCRRGQPLSSLAGRLGAGQGSGRCH